MAPPPVVAVAPNRHLELARNLKQAPKAAMPVPRWRLQRADLMQPLCLLVGFRFQGMTPPERCQREHSPVSRCVQIMPLAGHSKLPHRALPRSQKGDGPVRHQATRRQALQTARTHPVQGTSALWQYPERPPWKFGLAIEPLFSRGFSALLFRPASFSHFARPF